MLLDVLSGVVHETDDVVIVERVEGQTSGAPHTYQAGGAQQTKLVRDRRFAQANERRQVAHAAFAVRERVDEPNARRVAKKLEDVSDRIDG